MKKITIWDMDFYYKKSFQPNPIAMKLSSFHKQQEHLVNFVTEEYHITMSYDIYYIIKEKKNTPKPPGNLIDDKRVRLIGRPMRFFDNYWTPDAIVSAVRPDYLLYPENPKDAYYNANIAQFYHDGVLLSTKQPFENAIAYHKKTLVIDKEFWAASEENIISCLQELTQYRNVAFLHPIDVKKILKNKTIASLFIKLHYSPGTIFKFRNTYGSSYEDAIVIFDFLAELRAAHNHVKFGNMPIKAITSDHWESKEAALYDLERCFKIIDLAKTKKVHIRVVSPENRFDSPYWYYFEVLEYWTLNMHDLSYIEMMLFSATRKSGSPWMIIINNPRKWFTPNTYLLLRLISQTDWIEKYGLRQWGDECIDSKLIAWEHIRNEYQGMNVPEEKIMEE